MQYQSPFRWLLLVPFFLIFNSCTQEKYVGSLIDYPDEKDGLIKAYFETGILSEEGQFNNGQLDGFRKIYYSSGALEVQETYVLGEHHGLYVKYYENGQKKVEGDYVDGSMEGSWKTYYNDGSIKDQVVMHDNLESGPFVEFHQNGKTKATGSYVNGEFEQGELQLFDESGTLVRKMECDTGICKTIWTIEDSNKL